MEAEARYARIKELAASVPDFGSLRGMSLDESIYVWLGRLHASIDEEGLVVDMAALDGAARMLTTAAKAQAVGTIKAILFKALARAELLVPVANQGSFIAPGNAFDAIAALSGIMGSAQTSVLIIDPYLDEKALTTVAPMAKENVMISLMGMDGGVKASLEPAAQAWVRQYDAKRPLTIRLAPAKSLHDRLIVIDNKTAWDLSQSLNAFAERSPATLSKCSADLAVMKIEAYKAIWNVAAVMV